MSTQLREVVAVFDDAKALEDAVYELETQGFDRSAFSLLASEHAVEEKLGKRYRKIEEMEDEPWAPRETFFSRVSRWEAEYGLAPALGFIAAVVFGLGTSPVTVPMIVAAGGGAAIGAVLGRMIHERHAERLREQIERGGLLLWVNVHTPEEERSATTVLEAHKARHVHAHDVRTVGA